MSAREIAAALRAQANTLLALADSLEAPAAPATPNDARLDLLAAHSGTRRAAREWARRHGLSTVRIGGRLLVDRADYERALATSAKRQAPPVEVDDDDDAAILARAGLRVIGGRR